MASTINCYRGEAKIYDSVHTIPDAENRRIVKNIFHTASNPSFVMIKMQKQKRHVDCKVFAIAIATSCAYGIDPAISVLDQELMRRHLFQCLEAKKLTISPTMDTN